MYFYMLFSVAFLWSSKLRGVLFVVTLVFAMVLIGFANFPASGFLSNQIIIEFTGGMLVYFGFHRFSKIGFNIWGLLLALVGVAALAFQRETNAIFHGAHIITIGLPAFCFVLGVALNENALVTYVPELLKRLGDSSYSMYLSHPFSLAVAGTVFKKLGLSSHGPLLEAIYWIFVIFAALLLGFAIYRYVETPLNSLPRRLAAKREVRRASLESAATTT